MAQAKAIKLTKFELELMDALWELGRASIREVQEALPEKRRPAYTTVQTIIRRLEEKGAVRQVKKIGNALIFEAVVTREAAHRRWIDEVLDLFGGSPRPLLAHLIETGRLGLDDLRELESAMAAPTSGEKPERTPTVKDAERIAVRATERPKRRK